MGPHHRTARLLSMLALLLPAACGEAAEGTAPHSEATHGGAGGAAGSGGAAALGGAAGSGGTPISEGDVLRVESRNRGDDMTLLRDTKLCFVLTLVHPDGSRTRVAPGLYELGVEPGHPGVVARAEDTDCDTGGLIGLEPGVTPLTVTLRQGDVTLSAPALATVVSGDVAFSLSHAAARFSLAVGYSSMTRALSHEGTAFEPGVAAFRVLDHLPVEWTSTGGSKPRDAELVERWLTLAFEDGSLASVTREAGERDLWTFFGKATGTTSLGLYYAAPHRGQRVPLPTDVVQLSLSSGLRHAEVALMLAPENRPYAAGDVAVEPNVCVVPRLYASFWTSPAEERAVTVELPAATFEYATAGSATAKPGAGGSRCLAPSGLVTVKGCESKAGICGSSVFTVMAEGEPASLEVKAQGKVTWSPISSQPLGCVEAAAQAKLLTGDAFDVTELAAWSFRDANGQTTIAHPEPLGAGFCGYFAQRPPAGPLELHAGYQGATGFATVEQE